MTTSPFTESIIPVYYISKIIGLAPYGRHQNEYRPSNWASSYTILLILIYWMAFGTTIWTNIQNTNGDLSIATTTDYLQMSAGCVTQTICWINAVILQSPISHCFNLMNGVDVKLKKICTETDYQTSKKNIAIQQMIVWTIGIACCALVNTLTILNGVYTVAYFWITYYGPLSGLWALVSLYGNFTLALKKRFKALNQRLEEFKATKKSDRPKIQFISGSIIQVKPAPKSTYFTDEYKSITPPLKELRKLPTIEDKTQLSEGFTLQLISEIHDDLCEICKKFMRSHGVQCLVSIAFIFITTTCQLFYLLILSQLRSPESVASSTVWLLLYVFPLIVLCGSCHFCADEANNTGNILHSVQNYGSYNAEFKTMASLFSLQLIHHEISFTASGFFSIDFTLLQAILGAVTTYLVILLQFNAGFSKETTTESMLTETYMQTEL